MRVDTIAVSPPISQMSAGKPVAAKLIRQHCKRIERKVALASLGGEADSSSGVPRALSGGSSSSWTSSTVSAASRDLEVKPDEGSRAEPMSDGCVEARRGTGRSQPQSGWYAYGPADDAKADA